MTAEKKRRNVAPEVARARGAKGAAKRWEVTTPAGTPVTWRRVTLLRGPINSAATDPIVDQQICDMCVESFAIWIDGAEKPA